MWEVKYCEATPVVSITTRSDTKGITVSVRDNGIGIPRSEQKKIFDRLYRVMIAILRQHHTVLRRS